MEMGVYRHQWSMTTRLILISGNPVLYTEIERTHRPNSAQTQSCEIMVGEGRNPRNNICESWTGCARIVNCEPTHPPGLTVNCEFSHSSKVEDSHLIMLYPTLNSLIVLVANPCFTWNVWGTQRSHCSQQSAPMVSEVRCEVR